MAKYSRKSPTEKVVDLNELDVGTYHGGSTKLTSAIAKEKDLLIIIIICATVVIAAIITATAFLVKGHTNKLPNTADTSGYNTEIANIEQADKYLKSYDKSEKENGFTIYTKDDISVDIQTNEKGEVIYSQYQHHLAPNKTVRIKNFSKAALAFGAKKSDVLKSLAGNDYNYYRMSKDNKGVSLEEYRYGWVDGKVQITLTFIDNELTNYSLAKELEQ